MKRAVAVLMAASLIFQMWNSDMMLTQGAVLSEETGLLENEVPIREKSVLEVEISSGVYPIQGKAAVQVCDKSGDIVRSQELNFDDAGIKTARFELLPEEYTVFVHAGKYAEYKQSVQMENGYLYRIRISTAETDLKDRAARGWLRLGDVDGDGDITQKDVNMVMNAVRNSSGDGKYDCNGDGRVDLADLQCVVQNMGEGIQESFVERQKLVVASNLQATEGSDAVGIEEFLNHTGTLQLTPADTEKEISEENPVAMEFTLAGEKEDFSDIPVIQGMTIYAPDEREAEEENASSITSGEVTVVYADNNGEEKSLQIFIEEPEKEVSAADYRAAGIEKPEKAVSAAGYRAAGIEATPEDGYRAARTGTVSVVTEPDGSLVLDFGEQIAVKRVLIRITGTRKKEPLVHIAKVEFVNNMEDRIPPPQLDIPVLRDLIPGDKKLSVSWTAQNNITGYEVFVTGPVKGGATETQIVRVSNPEHVITGINDQNLVYNGKYTVKVRSVNGDWNSPWSEEKVGIVKAQKKPAAPDNVKAAGGYCSITVSWKNMEDSDGYMVYYKKAEEADTSFIPAVEHFTETVEGTGRINGNSYVLMSLEAGTEYEVYVKGWNEIGWGAASLRHRAVTLGEPPQLPDYRLINTSNGIGALTNHIESASYGGHGGAAMENSALDTEGKTAFGLVDDDFNSYWTKTDWDDGISYPGNDKGMTITLDADYKMKYITYAAANQQASLRYVRVGYWTSEDPDTEKTVSANLLERTDEKGNPFYIIKMDEAITAKKVHLSFGTGYSRVKMMIGEIHFHAYDSLEDDIMALYTDEMHITLRPDVTEETLNALEERLNTADEVSKEKHLLYDELMLEIGNAREILNTGLDPACEVENRITAQKDRHLGFGGLNSWQPIGKSVRAGEKLLVYVGHNSKKWGEAASLQIVFTQHHAESNALSAVRSLKVGRNEITVPSLSSGSTERGGQVYVSYTGNSLTDKYAVRVNGGSDIPVLNVFGKTGGERTAAIQAYVTELEAYVGNLESKHEAQHTGKTNTDYAYNQKECVLNATDIMMREMMYSVPATQVWAGIKNAEDKAAKLDSALQAMEQAMTLFYQHKGLSEHAGDAKGNNNWPAQHLNIRYMRMFAGAFMYASGNHIGIEWGSTALASSPDNMSGFGWGIAHEIGHNINQGSYAVAEITNNYFAQLLTGKIRYTYDNVYKKVTSGTKGRASNVFTQLALYWQLHLAFDDNKDDKAVYENYEEQFDNLFFARVDTYSRNPGKAPKAGLALNGGAEQNLMRLSCAAANKNILPFFERWGMTPDETTVAYAGKYGEADEKALYYINEAARDYRVEHPEQQAQNVKGKDVVTASVRAESNHVSVGISTNQKEELILGYEISRSMISNGEKKSEVIGFIPIDTAASTVYVDTVASINNRVMNYEVRAVDQYLNYSNPADSGAVKIQTDGVLDKSEWTVETDMVSEDDIEIPVTEEDPDSGYDAKPGNVTAKKVHSIDRILDNSTEQAGIYTGVSSGTSVITVDMHKINQVTSLKYQGSSLDKITVETSLDGNTWTKVKTDDMSLTENQEKEQTIWFDSVKEEARDNWIGTYDARYVRLTISRKGEVVIKEIDICGLSGDNLEFMTSSDGQQAIGVLSEDYRYGEAADDVILKGSLIFTGTYRGNWAYNVVVLYDAWGNVIGEKDGNVKSGQVIFAELPQKGNEGETTVGTWVYYVEPGQWNAKDLKGTKIRGELYRVDDAMTLEGERIVSDTQLITVPDTIPSITIKGRRQ